MQNLNSGNESKVKDITILILDDKRSANLADFEKEFRCDTGCTQTSISYRNFTTNSSFNENKTVPKNYENSIFLPYICKLKDRIKLGEFDESIISEDNLPKISLNWDPFMLDQNNNEYSKSRRSKSNLSDWFNYGLTDETFKTWIQYQLALRQKKNDASKVI